MRRPLRRFWFVLALALGATVGELQDRMGSHEFSEWLAYYQRQPFGDSKDDYRIGQLCSVVGNLFTEKGSEPLRSNDFFDLDPWEVTVKIPETVTPETKQFLLAIGAKKKGT